MVVDAFKATGVSLRRDILAFEDSGARNTMIFTDLGVVTTAGQQASGAYALNASKDLLREGSAEAVSVVLEPANLVLVAERERPLGGLHDVAALAAVAEEDSAATAVAASCSGRDPGTADVKTLEVEMTKRLTEMRASHAITRKCASSTDRPPLDTKERVVVFRDSMAL